MKQGKGLGKGIYWKRKEYFKKHYQAKEKRHWFYKRNDKRGFSIMINKIRVNYYNLNESLERKGIIKTARSECGAEKEDVNHVVFRCKTYDEERVYV